MSAGSIPPQPVVSMASNSTDGQPFPLTPALSLGEMGPHRPSVDKSECAGRFQIWEIILPLPKGEGRGEGKQDASQPDEPKAPSFTRSRRAISESAVIVLLLLVCNLPLLHGRCNSALLFLPGAVQQGEWW